MEKAKKIVFYLGSLGRGGTERVVVNLAEYLIQEGYQVTIATKEKVQEEYPVPEGVTRILPDITGKEISRSRTVNFCRRIKKLRNVWKQEEADLIVSFIRKNNYMAILSSMGMHTPVLVAVRSAAFREYPGINKKIANLLFPFAEGIIVQTPDAREYFNDRVRKKTVILPNSLHPDFICPLYEGKRESIIVSVGRLDTNKNQQMLVRAFAQIAGKYPKVKVIFYGDGEERKNIEKLIIELGVQEQIILAGKQSDIRSEIQKAEIFVLTSRVEGIPNALLEAMSLGLVPICTDFGGGGAKTIIEDGVNGFVVSVDDVNELTNRMEQLLQDEQLEEALRRKAIEVQETLQPERVNRLWKEYFEQFL